MPAARKPATYLALQEKFPIGEHGFCSVVMDTEGNTIGFHSDK